MLREILAITGRPGLFKIVSQGNNMIIVEDLATKRRGPAHSREKIVSLGDIAMYTEGEDLPLGEILDRLYAAQEGKPVEVKELEKAGKLADKFAEIVPDFDRDRVYKTDIRKLFNWYNILTAAGFTKFAEEKKAEESQEETPADKAENAE